jgi:hypothetical protein
MMLMILALTVVVVIGAVVFDAGMALSEKERVQGATDAAALAGAQALASGQGVGGATTVACDYYMRNGFDECPDVNIPPENGPRAGNASFVEVIGSVESPTPFISVFTESILEPEGRAVAGFTSGSPGYGIFAYVTNPPTNCTPPETNFPAGNVQFGGGGGSTPIVINGDLRTNGSLKLADVVQLNGAVTYGCQIGDISHVPPQAQQLPGQWPNPYPLTYEDFPCDDPPPGVTVVANVTGNLLVDHTYYDPSGYRVLKTGLYCATGQITVGAFVTGNVTFVAGGNILAGGGCGAGVVTNLVAYYADTLYFSNSSSSAAIRGPGGCTGVPRAEFTGIFAAPNGRISSEGKHLTINGGLIADQILFTSGDVIINANGTLGGGGSATALVE